MKLSKRGLELIKSYEGLRLEAYLCASGVVTIGYGHTGAVAQKAYLSNEPINETTALILLNHDLNKFEAGVLRLIPAALRQGEFDALVSFAFNVGLGALEDSTLRKRILEGEKVSRVIQEEFPRWNKGPNGPLEGLTKRRNAEVELATEQTAEQVIMQDCFLVRAAKNYKGHPHQKAAYEALQRSLTKEQLQSFKDAYSPSQGTLVKFPLQVPYFYQRDSQTGHGERMCFSSSMAMALDYIDPEVIQGDDDWYLKQVLKYGDTISSEAQEKTAHALGFDAKFHTNGSQKDLERLLDAGIPVPIGILHKGPVSNPTGGGHWICLIGHDEGYFMVHDPFGELDLVNGGYPKTGPNAGKNQLYSKKNLMKRWLIANSSDGWYFDLTQK